MPHNAKTGRRTARRRLIGGVAAFAAAATLLSGCSIDGTPTRGPIDLDTGPYGSRQSKPMVKEASDDQWPNLLGIRLAQYTVLREEIDPRLVDTGMPTFQIYAPGGLEAIYSGEPAKLPSTKNLRYGFTLSGNSGTAGNRSHGLNHAVLVYDSEASVGTAITELNAEMRKDDVGAPETIRVPGMPDTTVATSNRFAKMRVVTAFTPVGNTLVYTYASVDDAANDADWPVRTVKTAYEKQKALLDEKPADGNDRRPDPDDLRSMTIKLQEPQTTSGIVWDGRGILHFSTRQLVTEAAMKKAGVDRVATGDGYVARAASDEQAREFARFLGEDFRVEHPLARKIESPRDLSVAECFRDEDTYACHVASGRYVGAADGETAAEAQQKISAMYSFMAKR